jgi:hypothetical protein
VIARLRAAMGRGLDRRLSALEERLVADAARREHELAVAIDELIPRIDERVRGLQARLERLADALDRAEAAAAYRHEEVRRRLDDEIGPVLRAVVDEEASGPRRGDRAD